jgi:hypothetical protein
MMIIDDGSSSSKNGDDDQSSSSSSSSSGSEEGWMFLLGGISTELMASTTDWETTTTKEEIEIENENESSGSCHSDDKKSTSTSDNTKTTTYDDNDNKYISYHNNNDDEKIFKRAFKLSTTARSQIIKPPVKIYNNYADEGGNILIATKYIPRGETIFTEKAFIGIQVPVPFVVVDDDVDVDVDDEQQGGGRSRSISSSSSPSPSSSSSKEIVIESLYKVRACQNCFKSLEPASCLLSTKDNLPLSELWPIPEYDDNYNNDNKDKDNNNGSVYSIIELNSECNNNNNNNNKAMMVLHNKSRRVTCQKCNTIFCNRYCAQSYLHTMGSCCRYKRAIEGLIMVHHYHNNNIVNSSCYEDDGNTDDGDDDDDDDDDDDEDNSIHKYDEEEKGEHDVPTTVSVGVDIDPVIILATRMFIAQVQQYRNNSYNTENSNSNNTSSSSSSSLFDSLCGEVDDIHSFSLDTCSGVSDEDTLVMLSFQKEYEIITNAIELTQLERSMTMNNNDDDDNNESLLLLFSIQSFYKIISIAQRNSISLSTQSPFRTYYQEMIRKSGGRGSDRQQSIVSNIATILGSNDGKLTRNMDKIVEEKVRYVKKKKLLLWNTRESISNQIL